MTWKAILLAAAVTGAAQAQQTQGQSPRQFLRYATIQPSERQLGTSAGPTPRLIPRRPEGLALPEKMAADVRFAKWSSPLAKGASLWIALERAGSGPDDYRLWIDSDGNGSLADEEPHPPSYRGDWGGRWFGPVKVRFAGQDGPVTYHLVIYYRTGPEAGTTREHMWITAGGRYEGEVAVGGRKIELVLMDFNANGAFDDASLIYRFSDRLQVGTGEGARLHVVGKHIAIDGKLYRLNVGRDGAWVQFIPATDVPLATVRLPKGMEELVLFGENGTFYLQPRDGQAQLPAGKYRVRSWKLSRRDESGSRWELTASLRDDRDVLDLPAGKETRPDLAEPLLATLSARKAGAGAYSLSHALMGRMGEDILLTRDGERPAPPQVRIASADGSYDQKFSFEYG